MKSPNTSPEACRKMAENNEAYIYWLITCLEAYEASGGRIVGFPTFSAFTVAVEEFHKRLTALVDTLVTDITEDAKRGIENARILFEQRQVNPLFALTFPISLKEDTEQITQRKEELENYVRVLFRIQLERAQDLLVSTHALAVKK